MKIAVVGTRGFPRIPGGIEAHCENLYPRLALKGCEITVFTRQPYVAYPHDSYQGVKLVSLSCPKNKFLEAIIHTFKGVIAARKIKADILHIHGIGPGLCAPLGRLLGLKVVLTYHGPDYERKKWPLPAKLVLKLGEYLACRCAHKVIVISRYLAQSKLQGRPNIEIIPNGVAFPENAGDESVIKSYGLEKGKYILAVARFVPEKALPDLIDAFNIARPRGYRLCLVGSADHPDDYSRRLIEEAQNDRDIVLTGFLSGKPLQAMFSGAGLFVLPSYYEGLPIALLEAMSYGLSVIASDIPANREVGLAGERYFQPGMPQELARKLKEFVGKPPSNEERNKQFGLLKEKYDWDNIAGKTRALYQKVIDDT